MRVLLFIISLSYAISEGVASGFRPFYVGDTWIYDVSKVVLNTDSTEKWVVEVSVESEFSSQDTDCVILRINKIQDGKSEEKTDTVKENYRQVTFFHGSPNGSYTEYLCNAETIIPDDGVWNSTTSKVIEENGSVFSINKGYCGGSSFGGPATSWSLGSRSYADSSIGLLYRIDQFNSGIYGSYKEEIVLVKHNGINIDSKKISEKYISIKITDKIKSTNRLGKATHIENGLIKINGSRIRINGSRRNLK